MTPQAILSHYDQANLWPDERTVPADLPLAYQTALQLRALREERGEQVVGYKIGFTNRTLWERYQVPAPIWGPMWNTTVSHCDGRGSIELAGTSLPRLESEVVFGLARTPPERPTTQQVFDCIDWIAAGFEVVQSHCAGWKFTAAETIADGALHAHLLVGQRRPVRELAANADELDAVLATAQLELFHQGARMDGGSGASVLDSPLRALQHFIHEFQRLPQTARLMPGDVVTTGTWTDAWAVQAGESWQLKFDIGIAPLTVEFL